MHLASYRELGLTYNLQEFHSREAAEESVAKYHEGYFMGNKIRVELSRGGGRTAKYTGDPGACFKCGQMGHWARCVNYHDPWLQTDPLEVENVLIILACECNLKFDNPSLNFNQCVATLRIPID